MSQIKLKIVTPERVVYESMVDSVTLPTTTGEVTILYNHVPLVSLLRPGEVRTTVGNNEEHFLAVSRGFVEVRPGNEVVILAETAERAEELDIKKIEEARARAQEIMSNKRAMDDQSFAAAASAMERELARYKVASKRGRRTTMIDQQDKEN